MDPLPEQAALLDGDWNILAINPAWARYVAWSGFAELRQGGNFRTCAHRLAAMGQRKAAIAVRVIPEFDSGKRNRFRHAYAGEGPTAGHYFETIVQAFDTAEGRFITVIRHDLTQLHRLRSKRRQLGSKLLRAQEEERKRIARELHDSMSQLLIGLQIDLMRLRLGETGHEKAIVADMEEIVGRVEREIRALSYVTHPPPLAAGLAAAVQEMACGFGDRSGLIVEASVADIGGASEVVEAALYRFVQEALTNVHRHARANKVRVSLVRTERCIHLLVEDDGIGIGAPGIASRSRGLGMMGMKERLRDLGGRLSIAAAGIGTTLIASVPLHIEE